MKVIMEARDTLRLAHIAVQAGKGEKSAGPKFVAVLDCPFCKMEMAVTVRRDGSCRCFGSCPVSRKYHRVATLLKEFGLEVPDFGDIPDPVAGESLFPSREYRRVGVPPTGKKVVFVP